MATGPRMVRARVRGDFSQDSFELHKPRLFSRRLCFDRRVEFGSRRRQTPPAMKRQASAGRAEIGWEGYELDKCGENGDALSQEISGSGMFGSGRVVRPAFQGRAMALFGHPGLRVPWTGGISSHALDSNRGFRRRAQAPHVVLRYPRQEWR